MLFYSIYYRMKWLIHKCSVKTSTPKSRNIKSYGLSYKIDINRNDG